MTLIETIPFNRNNALNDWKLWVFSATIVLGGFLAILTGTLIILLVSAALLLIEWALMREKDGWLKIYKGKEGFYLEHFEEGVKLTNLEKIKQQKFGWHYAHFENRKGGTTSKTTHVNFTQLKYEILLESGKTLTVIKELHQWQSPKPSWAYCHSTSNHEAEWLITSQNLERLKEIVENHYFDKK